MSAHSRLPLAIVILLAGCSADTPAAPAGLDTPQFAHAAASVPIRATCEMVIEPAVPVGPGVISQVDSGACQVTHMGRTKLKSDKVINIPAGTQTTAMTFVAANGDILRGNGTGTNTLIAPGRVAFTAAITFTGGTGRFANASGEATITGEADLAAGRSSMVMEGSIRY